MPEIMQYVTRESAFHRLHPFTKLIGAVVVVALAVLTNDTVMLAVLVGAVVAAAAAGGLARDLLRQVPLLLSLAASLLLLTVLTIRSGDTLGFLVPRRSRSSVGQSPSRQERSTLRLRCRSGSRRCSLHFSSSSYPPSRATSSTSWTASGCLSTTRSCS